ADTPTRTPAARRTTGNPGAGTPPRGQPPHTHRPIAGTAIRWPRATHRLGSLLATVAKRGEEGSLTSERDGKILARQRQADSNIAKEHSREPGQDAQRIRPSTPLYLPRRSGPDDRIPIDGVQIHARKVLRSVHHKASNLSLGSGGSRNSSSKAHLPHVSTLSRPGTTGRVYETTSGGASHSVSLSCCLSATSIRFLGILSRQGIQPHLRSAYRPAVHARTGPWRVGSGP